MPIFANILQPLIDVFEWVLVNVMHDGIGLSWGWSIVGLTIVVRAILLPLAIRQYKSMKALQRHQPELQALREKYKGNKERLNQEMMKFYQENKVNPFGACLPLVFQLPVFISLFYMLRHDLRLDICPNINPPGTSNPQPCGAIPDAHFLGIPDITDKATGSTLVILILLYVGTQVISTLIMATPTMDRNQRYLMLGLPVIFVPFVIGFPAGLLVYWITTNIWTLIQQFTIRETLGRRWDRQFEAEKAAKAAEAEASGGKRRSGGSTGSVAGLPAADGGATAEPSGFFGKMMARAAEAQKTQQEQAKGGASKPATANGDDAPAPRRPASTGPPPSARKKKKRSGRRR